MNRILTGLLVFVQMLTLLVAQQPPANGAPQAAPANSVPQTGAIPGQTAAGQLPTPPDYSQEAYVIEHNRTSMRYENDGTGREEIEARVRIVSESGVQALGQFKIGYS